MTPVVFFQVLSEALHLFFRGQDRFSRRWGGGTRWRGRIARRNPINWIGRRRCGRARPTKGQSAI